MTDKISIDRVLHPKKKLKPWMVCMICDGVVQEPQKCNNCDHCVCSKCISDCCIKNSLEAKCKFCNSFSFTPLIDELLIKELHRLKFKCFLCIKSSSDGANEENEYIPYEKVKVHDIECNFKHKQNTVFNSDDHSTRPTNDAETKRRFNAQQNLNVRLKERMKDKIDVAQKVKDLYSGAKRKHQPIEQVVLKEPEVIQVPISKPQSVDKPSKQSSKSKIAENIEICFLCHEEVLISSKRFREIKCISETEPISAKLNEIKKEIHKYHVIKECGQRYVACNYCKTVVARKNLQNHVKTNCTEAIVKCDECLTEFKKDSKLLRTHSCEDKVTEKKYKEILQRILDTQEKKDVIAKNINKTKEEIETTRYEVLMCKTMIKKLDDYMEQNKRTLTDDECEELTNDTDHSDLAPKKMTYEEGFSYKKEHFAKITCHCVGNEGSDKFFTGDENGMIKQWNLECKESVATIDLFKMVDLLYPISELAKDDSNAPDVDKGSLEISYRLFGIQQFNSTSLCFGIGRYKTVNNQPSQFKTIFCCIQPDYKLKERELSVEKLPKLYDYRIIMENEEKINRMFCLSNALHIGNITKMIDLKTREGDYLASVDDKKTMIVWKIEDAKCNFLESFSKGFGEIETIIEFRNKGSKYYGCIALAFDDKRIVILDLIFRKSSKDPKKTKVKPEFKHCINMNSTPKLLCEVSCNQLVITSAEYLYYYNYDNEKCQQPSSPSVYQFQSICRASDKANTNVVTLEGAKTLKVWNEEKSDDKQITTKASDKIIWIEKIPGRRAIIICGIGGIMRFLVAYKKKK